jgi:hypothetical protein
LKIPDSVNRSTDKTMTKRKTKGQTVNYKTLHRKLLIEEQESLFTKNKMKETAAKINFRRFDFIMIIPRSIFSFILFFCLHWISESQDLNNMFCCSTASWMCTIIKYVILPIIYPTFFNIFHYKSRMNVYTKKNIMVLYLFFVILR